MNICNTFTSAIFPILSAIYKYIFTLYLQIDDNVDSPAGSRRSSEQVCLMFIICSIKLFIALSYVCNI